MLLLCLIPITAGFAAMWFMPRQSGSFDDVEEVEHIATDPLAPPRWTVPEIIHHIPTPKG